MAITISGENNNDKILASDGVIDQISGFNLVGVITATSFTGDLTGDVTGNLTGNVTGNINNSTLLLQTGGSERFRITGNNELGIAGANYGTSGQVLTSGGSGSAVSWTTPAVTGLVNGADNRIVTCTSASAIRGETGLTYNGSTFSVAAHTLNFTQSGNVVTDMHATGGDAKIVLDNSGNNNFSGIDFVRERSTGTGVVGGTIFMKSDTSTNDAYLYLQAQSASAQSPITTALSDNNGVRLILKGGDGIFSVETGSTEKLSISSDGGITVQQGNGHYPTTFIGGSTGGRNYLTVRAGNTTDGHYSGFNIQDSSANHLWQFGVEHNTDDLDIFGNSAGGNLRFWTKASGSGSSTIKMQLTDDGNLGLGDLSNVSNVPQVLLHIANTNPIFRIQDTTNDFYAHISSDNGGNLILDADAGDGAGSSYMLFKTDGSEKLRITSDGALGIGNLQTAQSSTTHTSKTKFYLDSTKFTKIARLAAGNISSAGWFTVAKIASSNGNYFKCYASIGGDFTQDVCVMELTGAFSASGGLSNTYAEPVFKAHRVGAHSTDRITRARFVKDSSNLTYLQIYIAGGVNNNTWGKSVLEYNIGAYSQNNADNHSAAMFEAQASGLTGIRTLEVDDNAICTNAGSYKFYSGGNATERLTIDSSGRVLINTTNNSNGNIASSKLAVEGGDFAIFKDSGGDNVGVSGHKLKFVTQSGSIGEIDVLSEGAGGPAGRGGIMRFYTKANNTSSAAERLRITSNGIVNIGVTGPQYAKKVNIQGDNGYTLSVSNQDYTGHAAGSHSGIEGRIQCGGGIWTGAAIRFVKHNGTSGDKHSRCELYSTNGYSSNVGLVVQPDGEVTKPLQPSFHVGSPYNSGNASGEVWKCHANAIYSNVGNHYDNSTGRFTAPVDGQYFFFHWGMTQANNNSTADVYSRKNGSRDQIGTSYNGNGGTTGGYHQFGCSYVRTLSAGDYVDVYTLNGSIYNTTDGRHGGWGGHLIG